MTEVFEFSLSRNRLSEQVANQLQQLIVDESLVPGDKLPGERELAQTLGVSRTVVREALRVLGVRGLVRVKPGCGSFVRELSLEDATAPMELFFRLQQAPDSLKNLMEVRRLIEVEVASLAAERATEEDLTRLASSIEEMEGLRGEEDRIPGADLAFHLLIADATHNPLFPLLLSPITDLLSEAIAISYRAPGASDSGLAHHRSIVLWLRAHDAERARDAMCRHIDESERLIRRVQGGLYSD